MKRLVPGKRRFKIMFQEFVKLADDQLVSLAQEGDNRAFAELIRRHQPACAKLALSILRDKQDAEDEVQNAWLESI